MAHIYDTNEQLDRMRKAKIYNKKRNKQISEAREKKDLHEASQIIRTLNAKIKPND